jgi:Uma2 family endonuclease
MAGTKRRIREGLTLEEFLQLPEEKPYLEYIDGRIEAKVAPQFKHGLLQLNLANALNSFAMPTRMGVAIPELRCTFAGRSIVGDIVYLRSVHIELDSQGEPVDRVKRPPDIEIEIISPEQSVRKADRKLTFSVANGCSLGWLIHPYKRTVTVYRPDQEPETLGLDGTLDGADVVPGFQLPVAELFGWLKLWRQG